MVRNLECPALARAAYPQGKHSRVPSFLLPPSGLPEHEIGDDSVADSGSQQPEGDNRLYGIGCTRRRLRAATLQNVITGSRRTFGVSRGSRGRPRRRLKRSVVA